MPVFILIILVPQVVHAFSFSKLFGSFQQVGSFVASADEIEGAIHNVTRTPALRAALNADPNPAKGGGDITIAGGVVLVPEIGPSGTLADIEVARPGQDQISIYVVREGDTLSQIAELFNVSTNTLVWSNDLGRGNVIRPGETLVILPVSGVRHTVEKGDTLAKIVKRYEGDVEEVLEFNGLTEDATLAVGSTVVVPYGVMPQSASPSVSTSAVAQGAGGPQLDGYFLRPVVGGIRTQGVHGYNGIDIAAAVGTPVLASASGEVIISRSYGYNGGYGQYIVIRHPNGTQTLYAHLSANNVFAGAQVVQGQVIGAIGNTGRSTGPHVHFEVRGARNPF
ncbi:MAG: peptidoglycan DD-metalloendopeptidase family protein [Patescibacteria group bacterium UBA2163]